MDAPSDGVPAMSTHSSSATHMTSLGPASATHLTSLGFENERLWQDPHASSMISICNPSDQEDDEQESDVYCIPDQDLVQDIAISIDVDINQVERLCPGNLQAGQRFNNLTEARSICEKFAKCTIVQKSQKNHKFVIFSCFRSGSYTKRASKVPVEYQRKKKRTNATVNS